MKDPYNKYPSANWGTSEWHNYRRDNSDSCASSVASIIFVIIIMLLLTSIL